MDEVDLPAIVREVFPDPSPGAIAAALEDVCRRTLGAGIARTEFFAASVGTVHGLALRDGRRVVVKAHGPRTSLAFLEAMQAVQRRLADAGFPAPMPLAGPVRLGRGVAVAETLLDAGRVADARDPAVRRALAAALARLVALARPLAGLPGLRESIMAIAPGRLWPAPHDARFDFDATAAGAEWIDRIARTARAARDRPAGDLVVGHTDWRAEHVRFADGRLCAVYDWDSVAVDREPVIVGAAAHAFTANWAAGEGARLPTCAEALAFVGDYEEARGRAFTAVEARVARAALVYAMAYTARCEHSDALTDFGRRAPAARAAGRAAADSARGFLAAHAAALLAAGVRAGPSPS